MLLLNCNTQEPPDTVDFHAARVLVRAFNEATSAIACWDEYRASMGSRIVRDCGEKMYSFDMPES